MIDCGWKCHRAGLPAPGKTSNVLPVDDWAKGLKGVTEYGVSDLFIDNTLEQSEHVFTVADVNQRMILYELHVRKMRPVRL